MRKVRNSVSIRVGNVDQPAVLAKINVFAVGCGRRRRGYGPLSFGSPEDEEQPQRKGKRYGYPIGLRCEQSCRPIHSTLPRQSGRSIPNKTYETTSGHRLIERIRPASPGQSTDGPLIEISPHVMRHTFGSRLGMAGVDPRTIRKPGHWSSLAMVQSYVNLRKTPKTEAIEKLSAATECYVLLK